MLGSGAHLHGGIDALFVVVPGGTACFCMAVVMLVMPMMVDVHVHGSGERLWCMSAM